MKCEESFSPPPYLRPALVQSVLASSKARARGSGVLTSRAREVLLEAGDGVRLLGLHTPAAGVSKGLVVLIHGWEGGAGSAYILGAGCYLYDKGFSVFRLNLRDHGETHHLNEGIFYATMVEETFQALVQAAKLAGSGPVFLAGFSLGGNFALRLGLRNEVDPIFNLRQIVAVSPVLDPDKATTAVDSHRLFRWYFMKKWRRSLVRKQACFPSVYNFEDMMELTTIRSLTEALLARCSEYPAPQDYFARYNLTGQALAGLSLPTTIIAAADDPIIPADDFRRLVLNRRTALFLHDHGGHSGFIETLGFRSWHERKMADLFEGESS
jgi:hypothetical protein